MTAEDAEHPFFRAAAAYAPPDPYAPHLEKMREQTFEQRYKDQRTRELAAERATIDAHIAAASQPRLTAAETAKFAPPDPYRLALAKLKETSR
jgi:hypothetical protein